MPVGTDFFVPGIIADQPLPSYARPDLAFLEQFSLPTSVGFPGFGLITPGAFFEVVLSLFFHFAADATVVNRLPFFVVAPPNGSSLGHIPVPTAISAGQSLDYTYSVASIGTVGPLLGQSVISMPTFLLWPGASYGMTCANGQPGDVMSQITLSRVRIPTGPPKDSESVNTSIPTPILL